MRGENHVSRSIWISITHIEVLSLAVLGVNRDVLDGKVSSLQCTCLYIWWKILIHC